MEQKMKQNKKISLIIIILLICFAMMTSKVYAAGCYECTNGKIRGSVCFREIVLSV